MPGSPVGELAIFGTMRKKFLNILAWSLPVQILLIQWAAANPQWVEQFYSNGIYPIISGFFRGLYGWIPFSVGDLLYLTLICWGIVSLVQNFRRFRTHFRSSLRNIVAGFAILHFTFYLLWGLNYFRTPLGVQLGLDETFREEELLEVVEILTDKVNSLQMELTGDSLNAVAFPQTRDEILKKTLAGYDTLGQQYPQLKYSRPSLKKSLISTPLSYMGYGGYLNPFTGEAQVNARLPLFRFPVVCGHEVAHQLGYSAENETNFIGYLVTANQGDPYFQYAAEGYALGYCLASIGRYKPELSKALIRKLNPGVRRNYAEMNTFWEQFENPMEPVFKAIFNTYLEANRQKDGIKSYGRVVALIVAYHRGRNTK